MNSDTIVAVDAGGSTTDVLCGTKADFDSGEIACHSFGPGNFRQIGVAGVAELANQIVRHFDIAPQDAQVIGGFAGAGDLAAYDEVTEGFSAAGFPSRNVTITNDGSLLLAALKNRGIVLIAGTGGICIGRNGGTDIQSDEGVERAGGYGFRVDSEPSGYYLGRGAIDVALKIEDGRVQEPSVLHEWVRTGLGIPSFQDIIPILYPAADSKASVQARVASLAPLVLEAAAKGDNAAREIVTALVGDMADHLQAVCKRMGVTTFPVLLYGGLFESSHAQGLLLEPLRAHQCLDPYRLSMHVAGDLDGELNVLREAVLFVTSTRNR